MILNVNITGDVTAETRAMLASVRSADCVRAAARGVQAETKDFYAGLEQTRPNKQGWPRQHFWAAVRRSVNQPVVNSPTEATVSIADPNILQRIRGGYIRPLGHKYLTLPATAEAYGKRAREFHNLRFGFAENKFGNLAPALVENSAQRVAFGRRRKDNTRKVTPGEEVGGKAFFWLVKQVYQQADPTAMPTQAQLQVAAVKGANEWASAAEDQANKGGKT
jgi:hypothetical protein